jgi:hypothetical protein
VKVELEITGGFTGRAGAQKIDVDTSRLPPKAADDITRDLEHLPPSTWRSTFLKAHPAPWDFVHVLRVVDAGGERATKFHLNEGPKELSTLAERLKDLQPT